jgi:hypothetical protein
MIHEIPMFRFGCSVDRIAKLEFAQDWVSRDDVSVGRPFALQKLYKIGCRRISEQRDGHSLKSRA